MLSAAIRRGLIEAYTTWRKFSDSRRPLSAAIRRGLIEAVVLFYLSVVVIVCYPRRFAAASLKRLGHHGQPPAGNPLSAAIRRGLIEAPRGTRRTWTCCQRRLSAAIRRGLIEARLGLACASGSTSGYPRRFAAASLKPAYDMLTEETRTRLSAAIRRGLIEASAACPRKVTV